MKMIASLTTVMKRWLTLWLTLFSMVAFSQTEHPQFAHLDEIDKQVIPEDTSVRKGVLDNGLTFYVCRCDKPEKLAFLQLLVKGGSILENDNERGIAHFVEHMMFKGTKHFPGNEVVGFMRRNGIPFGHDSNAFTGFNTVRYFLNSIPANNELLMDSCLLLLRDWAGDATIDSKDVESEHKVIVEEWRSKSTNSHQLQMMNDAFNNSIYAKRIPIGDLDIVQNCSQKLVSDFYKRWYQPQNQALVIVGDFDPDEMVKKIQDRFGDMKRGENIPPTPPTIPDRDTPIARIYQDNNIPFNSTSIVMRWPEVNTEMKNTIGAMRTEILRAKINTIMNEKLSAIKSSHKEIYGYDARLNEMADVGNAQLFTLNLNAAPEHWKKSLEWLAKQVELIRRKGFKEEDWDFPYTSPEYNADSTAILWADTTFANYGKKNSKDLANNYIDNFFKGDAIISDLNRQLVERHVNNTISQEQLHREFLNITGGRNMIISSLFPKEASLPSEDEVMEVFNRVKSMTDEELADIKVTKPKKLEKLYTDSLDLTTIPGTVKKTNVLNDNITEVLLSNGVKVVLWKKKSATSYEAKITNGDKVEHKKNSGFINFMIRRPSGFSVLKDEDIFYSDMLSSCIRKYSWWGGQSNIIVEPFNDTFDTQAINMEKVEDCLKMMHASLTSTEVDSVEFEERLKKLQATAVAASHPNAQAQMRIANLPALSAKRLNLPTVEEAASYNINRFRELVKDYYSNYNGAVLIVQGDFDTDSIMPPILKYIASLPSKPEPVKRMTWPADHYRTTDTIAVEKIENQTPFCATFLFYTWEKDYNYTLLTHAHNEVLQAVLRNILFNILRVQHSDVYTPNCAVVDDLLPVNRMKCTITYTCDPTQRERIAKDVNQLVHDMADGELITQELIDGYVKEREKNQHLFKDNDFTLRSEYLTRELDGIVVRKGDISYIKQVTPASLKAHLKQLLKLGNLHLGYLTTE